MTPILPIRLRFLKGERVYDGHQPTVLVGRSAACQLCLSDNPAISSIHAKLYFQDGCWYLMDMGSLNGTSLNRVPLEPRRPYPLKAGDRIIFARNEYITVEFIADSAASSATQIRCPVCGFAVSGAICPVCGFRISSNAPERREFSRREIIEEPYRFPDASRSIEVHDEPAPPRSAPPNPAPPRPAPPRPAAPAPFAPSPAPYAPPPPMAAPSAAARQEKANPQESPKKKGLFGGLFGKKDRSPQPLQPDDVQFRAAAPASLKAGEYFTVKVMMYREDDYQRADREQMTLGDKVKASSSGIFQARNQERFRVVLQSPDIPLDGESGELVWNGKYAATELEVLLPQDFSRTQLRLTGRVYSGIAVLTDLKLILQVEAARPQEIEVEKCRLRSAFISYASQDRAKVVARIQGIQLSCPDMDLFFDAESLRRGELWEQRLYREIESRDLFYLFWSRNAANSQWVSRELAYAVEKKGLMAVEPVPLEDPAICPPPQCLQNRHFNDWTLRYLNDQ